MNEWVGFGWGFVDLETPACDLVGDSRPGGDTRLLCVVRDVYVLGQCGVIFQTAHGGGAAVVLSLGYRVYGDIVINAGGRRAWSRSRRPD